jgi:pyruvate dehydrogenase E2 component (dihydrolipoamide acetyltransferase)
MPFEVKLPDIGEGVAEGEIVRWLVKAGDSVTEHQPLVEVMTDKASVEIPSPRTGKIAALLAEEGAIVPVGTVIISIEVAGEAAAATPSAGARAQTHAAPAAPARPASAPSAGGGKVQAMPAVRALAKELGVALEAVSGSGPGGAITAEDVRRTANGASAVPAPTRSATAAPGEKRIPLRGLRRKIAEHMRHSLDTAAHFTFVAECDMTALVQHRERLLPSVKRQGGTLTYLAYLVKALGEPLRAYPLLNARLDDEKSEIVLEPRVNIGIATATEEGLTVPVVHEPENKTLLQVASEIQRLAAAARAGSLELEELQGGTFTVTSTGAHGGLLATPILHHPQVAILGVHEVKKKPAVVDGQIVARDLTNLSLSLDHRVVDGAVGADFLYALIARLERPEEWLTPEVVG